MCCLLRFGCLSIERKPEKKVISGGNEMYTRRTKPPMRVNTDRRYGAVLRSECRHRLKWRNLTITAKMQIGFWNRLLLTCLVLFGWHLFWIFWKRSLSVTVLRTCIKKIVWYIDFTYPKIFPSEHRESSDDRKKTWNGMVFCVILLIRT